jgi:hypothetical protein
MVEFNMHLMEIECELWTGFFWLRVWTGIGPAVCATSVSRTALYSLVMLTDRQLCPSHAFCATNSQTPVAYSQSNSRVNTDTEMH